MSRLPNPIWYKLPCCLKAIQIHSVLSNNILFLYHTLFVEKGLISGFVPPRLYFWLRVPLCIKCKRIMVSIICHFHPFCHHIFWHRIIFWDSAFVSVLICHLYMVPPRATIAFIERFVFLADVAKSSVHKVVSRIKTLHGWYNHYKILAYSMFFCVFRIIFCLCLDGEDDHVCNFFTGISSLCICPLVPDMCLNHVLDNGFANSLAVIINSIQHSFH